MPEHAIIRAITTIDDDGDAAWRVLAVSSGSHTLAAVLADWSELTSPPLATSDGVGVASPLLFVIVGSLPSVRRASETLRQEANDLARRLRTGESDLSDELAWLARPLRRRGGPLTAASWRALALRHVLADEEQDDLPTPALIEGRAGDDWLAAFYVVPPNADAEEVEGLAERGVEAWLHLTGTLEA
jgi:hypothetical protein